MTIREFEDRVNCNNGYDREFSDWKILDIHQVPTIFTIQTEVDFYCCNGLEVFLLRIRKRALEKFSIVSDTNIEYFIAEIPFENIDNTLLSDLLFRFANLREEKKLRVIINKLRPDFRVFATYFFGSDLYNYDSEGDSNPVTSKKWTELYMCCRENQSLKFEIYPIKTNPLTLEVCSKKKEITNIISYFLALETNGDIFNLSNQHIKLDELKRKVGDFKLNERVRLAKNSVWRKATEENPYPNLNITN